MKCYTLALGAALLVAACSDTTTSAEYERNYAFNPGTRVTGSGHLERDLGEGAELTTFSYSAIARDGGTAQGQFQFNFRAANLVVHGAVTCVTTLGNTAWIGGYITKLSSADPADQQLVGTDVWWRVRDNGEGDASPPDMTTSLLFTIIGVPITAESWCRDQLVRGLERPIQHGNIQVDN